MALTFPNIDPVAIHLGPLEIRWYALAYLSGFLIGWWIAKYICRLDNDKYRPNSTYIDDFMTWAILGIILGGRLGYILFYNLPHYMEYPLDVFKIWQGGMAFHGALIGVIVVIFAYALIQKISILRLADLFAVSAPIGFFFGRLANFINGELYGRATTVDWGMVFPRGGDVVRHPSQLYQAGLEGAALFIILFTMAHIYRIRNCPGLISAAFMFFYGAFRFVIEYFREPDAQLGLFFNAFSMGQMLCVPMMLGAIILVFIARYAQKRDELYGQTV